MSVGFGQVITPDVLNRIWQALKGRTAVIEGLNVVPTEPASLKVIVKAGRALFDEVEVEVSSDVEVSISTPDADYPRWDLITLKSDGSIGYYTGDPAPQEACYDSNKPETCLSPVPPNAPIGEIPLAYVWVPANASAVDHIVDLRPIISNKPFFDHVDLKPLDTAPDVKQGRIWFRKEPPAVVYSLDGQTWDALDTSLSQLDSKLAQIRDRVTIHLSSLDSKLNAIFVDQRGRIKTGVIEYAQFIAQKIGTDTIVASKDYGGYVLMYPLPLGTIDLGDDYTEVYVPDTGGEEILNVDFVSMLDEAMHIDGIVRVRTSVYIESISGNTYLTTARILLGVDDGSAITWIGDKTIIVNKSVGAGNSTDLAINVLFDVDRTFSQGERLVLGVRLSGYNDYSSGAGKIRLRHYKGSDDTYVLTPVVL